MMGINEKDERRELLDAVADAERLATGLDQLLESMAHRRGRAHPGGAERGLLCRGARACSQHRPSKRNAPLSAGRPSRCPPRLFDSGRRPELGRP